MKKLMIAAAIVCAAAFAQAATISWDETTGAVYDTSFGNPDGVTAYLIYSETIDQDSLVRGLTGADYESTVASYAADTTTMSVGQFAVAMADPSSGVLPNDGDGAYFVLFNGDEMYVSEEEYFAYDDGDQVFGTIFDGQYGSLDPIMDAEGGYVQQGWYQAVPEPTTGLLMLFGLAGLALKRKRA